MRTSDFEYELPEGSIAQAPAQPRDRSRLLVHRRSDARTEHRHAADLPDLLAPGDLLVVNDTRVICARLLGRRSSGGAVELLLLERVPGGRERWRALAKPARRLRGGEELELEGGGLRARLVERTPSPDGTAGGPWILDLLDPEGGRTPMSELLERHGRMPLPPYVRRPRGEDPRRELDRVDYQTVFARHPGAVAAPTAGLHFTPELLARLEERGIERASVTLHVGEGTFRPLGVERIEQHAMHTERYELPPAAVAAIEACRARGGRVVAVGTTSVRVLETCARPDGGLEPGEGETDLFIRPGTPFRAVDALLTNFHLPRSTLLMLVCAFAGRERVLGLYREAVERGYRFYSYGDAMLLL